MQTKSGIKKENTNSKRWNNTTVPRISSKILASCEALATEEKRAEQLEETQF